MQFTIIAMQYCGNITGFDMSARIVINKALGAWHCTINVHPEWFGAYPKGYIDKIFLRNWQELDNLKLACNATFKELNFKGTPGSVLKRVELNFNQAYPKEAINVEQPQAIVQ